MGPEHYQRVKEVFLEAITYEGADRIRFLESACGVDEDLRREVESLLSHHDVLREAEDRGKAPAP